MRWKAQKRYDIVILRLGGYPESEARYFIAVNLLNDNSLTENCMKTAKEQRSGLDQDSLKEILHYEPDTGLLTAKTNRRKISIGQAVGTKTPDGYIQVGIQYELYLAHRLIWLYMTGDWPADHIDHINHIRDDNRWANIRSVTQAENNKNLALRSDNSSGVSGIYWAKAANRWIVNMWVNGKNKNLGSFKCKFEALCCRQSAANELGYHANHGLSV